MRRPTMGYAMRFHTLMAVLMTLAVTVAYSQSRTRISPRARSRSDWQQGQTAPQAGQPDFARRMAERHARQRQEMQQDMEEMRRWAEESRDRAMQQALRATDDQWRRLKPRLERIQRLKAEADVAVDPGSTGGSGNFQGQNFMFGGGFGGGMGGGMGGGSVDIMDPNASTNTQTDRWGGSWSSGPKSVMEMTEGETLCQELQHMLQGESVTPAQIAQKVEALRKVRVRAREDLARARTELRTLIAPHQEPALIVMGYLD